MTFYEKKKSYRFMVFAAETSNRVTNREIKWMEEHIYHLLGDAEKCGSF